MDEEACQVLEAPPRPPAKKRRVEARGLDASWELRKRTYQNLWQTQQDRIDAALNEVNEDIVTEIETFINHHPSEDGGTKLHAGFILTGPSGITSGGLFERLRRSITSENSQILVPLETSDCPNLKSCLKAIIRKGTDTTGSVENDNTTFESASGSRLMTFDLQLLQEFCMVKRTKRLVVAFLESEAFEASLLSELIILLHSWSDRIPFVLLFGVATTVDLLQDRMTRAAARCIEGREFNTASNDEVLEVVFERVTSMEDSSFRLGPVLSNMLLQRQMDHTQGTEAFIATVKYAYMCHFYANPLTVFLGPDTRLRDLNSEHFAAVRNLPSFQRYVEGLVEVEDTQKAQRLLQSNTFLFDEVTNKIKYAQDQMVCSLGAIRIVQFLQSHVPFKTPLPYSALYIKLLSGKSEFSTILRELMLLVKRVPSDILFSILPPIVDIVTTMPFARSEDFIAIQEAFSTVMDASAPGAKSLRSELGLRHETLRTTSVARKVELTKQKSQFSTEDAAYSRLLSYFSSLIEIYFGMFALPMSSIVLHEILFYDLVQPHRDVFAPKPSATIERSLFSPHDYLACACCGDTKGELAASQPPVAILYQLYLESGALINVSDLWSAFHAIVGDQYDGEHAAMALFLRSLAELKYMAYVKQSRKKTDHLAKLGWKGL